MKRLVLLTLLACSPSHKPEDPKSSGLVDKLKAKEAGWLLELKTNANALGWPDAHDCDQTLWAGEARAAGAAIDLHLAEYNPGEIHRRPEALGECYPTESASTISNDMLLGYLLGTWEARDADALIRLAQYGEVHNWVMGQPLSEPRVILSPTGQGLLGRAIEKLGGPKKSYSILPDPCLPVEADYERHLQVVGIYLDGRISGGISSICLDALNRQAKDAPLDALFQAARGIYDADEGSAISLLLNDQYQTPSYVRGAPAYEIIHKLLAGRIVLNQFGE